MERAQNKQFSEFVNIFHEFRLPVPAKPAGYAALIDAYGLKVPYPLILSAIGKHHRMLNKDGWRIYTPRYEPDATLAGHLTFALKQEGIDLAVLKALFLLIDGSEIEAWVRAKPTGTIPRRIWFLYEWLTGMRLDLPDAKTGQIAPVINPKIQYANKGKNASRYRVKNNLPGTPEFCPLVFKTKAIEKFIALQLSKQARNVVKLVPKNLLARTAAFIMLKDSRSSFAIEKEKATHNRILGWGRAIGEAGRHPLDLDELKRLQKIVIEDDRFTQLGLRTEGGFVGDHDQTTRMPLPDHIDARHDDLESLINGLIAYDRGPAKEIDPVIAAAVLAFGFVYIHPFEDGNGRLHRYLIHHVLAEQGFNPTGMIFPVSAAILDQIDEYQSVLESYSSRLLPLIEWEPTKKGNVRVLNDTADFYRFFDATPHVEFLYACIQRTIEIDIPQETEFLKRFDEFTKGIEAIIDMPRNTTDLLFNFLDQNDGKLSKRARNKEFAALTDEEVKEIEDIYGEARGE